MEYSSKVTDGLFPTTATHVDLRCRWKNCSSTLDKGLPGAHGQPHRCQVLIRLSKKAADVQSLCSEHSMGREIPSTSRPPPKLQMTGPRLVSYLKFNTHYITMYGINTCTQTHTQWRERERERISCCSYWPGFLCIMLSHTRHTHSSYKHKKSEIHPFLPSLQ